MQRRPVNHVRDAAVAGDTALVRGFSAWFIGRLLEDVKGGLETVLQANRVTPERRADVLRAHAALLEVGATWRLAQAASGSGSENPDQSQVEARSGNSACPSLGSRDVANALDVSDRQARSLAAQGLLRAERDAGGRWQFDPDSVREEQERRRAMSEAAA